MPQSHSSSRRGLTCNHALHTLRKLLCALVWPPRLQARPAGRQRSAGGNVDMQEGSCSHRATEQQRQQRQKPHKGMPRAGSRAGLHPPGSTAPAAAGQCRAWAWQHPPGALGNRRHTPVPSCASASPACQARGSQTDAGSRSEQQPNTCASALPARRAKVASLTGSSPLAGVFQPSPAAPTPARGPPPPQRTRWAEKDWRLLFQKASTKILLYLMAMGHTVAPAGQHSTARTSQRAQHG